MTAHQETEKQKFALKIFGGFFYFICVPEINSYNTLILKKMSLSDSVNPTEFDHTRGCIKKVREGENKMAPSVSFH